MPPVWIRDDPQLQNRFHRSPDCRQLKKKPAKGHPHTLVAKDLNEVFVRPCLTCYPDAPRIKIIRRYCEVCSSAQPCKHNGGVLVTTRIGRQFWVWPDSNLMPLYRRTS